MRASARGGDAPRPGLVGGAPGQLAPLAALAPAPPGRPTLRPHPAARPGNGGLPLGGEEPRLAVAEVRARRMHRPLSLPGFARPRAVSAISWASAHERE